MVTYKATINKEERYLSNSNGYLSRNLLDELDKKKEKKTAAPIVDNWQRLSASQQAAQKADAEAKQTAEPAKFSTGKLIEGIVRKGATNAAHGMSSTLSWRAHCLRLRKR